MSNFCFWCGCPLTAHVSRKGVVVERDYHGAAVMLHLKCANKLDDSESAKVRFEEGRAFTSDHIL